MKTIVIIGTLTSGFMLIAVPQEHRTIRLIAGLICLIGILIMINTKPPRP